MTACRILQAVLFSNAPLTTALEIAVTASAAFKLSHCTHCAGHLPILSTTGFVCLSSTCCAWILELSTKAEARATVRALEANDMEGLIRRLLVGVCDAVFHLDSELTISNSGAQLRSLLLYRSHADFMGRSFCLDICVEHDRDRVAEQLKGGHVDAAGTFHTHLRDSAGVCVPTRIFHAMIASADQSLQIIRIKEGKSRGPHG